MNNDKEIEQKNGEDPQINTPIYVGLSAVIILLLVLMFIVTNLNYYMRQRKDVLENKDYVNLEKGEDINVIERESVDRPFTLLVDKNSKIEDGLKQAKIPYSLVTSLREIKNTDENLILDGNMLTSTEDSVVLRNLVKEKRKIMFLSLPSVKYIEDNNLKEILGISSLKGQVNQKELNLVPGFMLGGLHEFKNLPYENINVKLLYSTKVYGYGKKDSPTIWRNIYGGSEIYVVNGTFMEGNASYGILSSLMSELYEDYIYPIVNARFMVYEDFPYISDENKNNLEKLYNRNAMKFQYDILMPDILTINERREFVPNGYLRVGFKENSAQEIDYKDIRQLNNTKSQIYRAGGDIGIRYSGDGNRDRESYQKVFKGEKIKSVIVDENPDNMKKILGISSDIESVIGPWEGKNTFEYISDDTVYIPFTVNGIKSSGKQRLEFISAVTSLGVVVHNLSIEEMVLNVSDKENWTSTSKEYIKYIDDYRERFEFLKSRNISSVTKAVKTFKNSNPKIIKDQGKIELIFEKWNGPSDFILRSHKDIDSIAGGTYQEIEKDVYLITALEKNIKISLSPKKNTKARR